MKTYLVNVHFQDNKGKYWHDNINNKIAEGKDEQDAITTVIEAMYGMDIAYKGKPQANVFIDDKEGNAKAIGYIYRVSTEIHNRDTGKWEKARFDAWADARPVGDYVAINIEK